MNEQVMIYEVKSAASSNAQELFSDDSKYFYWNETKFKNLKIGDFVFVVNRTNKWVVFCYIKWIANKRIFIGNNKKLLAKNLCH